MESKINRIINMIRNLKEDGAIGGEPTNSVGDGGLTGRGEKLAGYDKVMGLTRRTGIIGKGKFPGARTRWKPNPPQL